MSAEHKIEIFKPDQKIDTLSQETTDVNTDLDIKKQKKVQQLKLARESKRALQILKNEEDLKIKEQLLQLQTENEQLRKKSIETPINTEPEKKDSKPIVVIRQDSDSDESGDENKQPPSIVREACKLGIVGLLGLGSFYVQNHLFRTVDEEKKIPFHNSKPTEKATTTATSQAHTKRRHPLSPAALPTMQNPKKKLKIGKSGFTA